MFTPLQTVSLIFLALTLLGALGLIIVTIWIPAGPRNNRIFNRILGVTMACLLTLMVTAVIVPLFGSH